MSQKCDIDQRKHQFQFNSLRRMYLFGSCMNFSRLRRTSFGHAIVDANSFRIECSILHITLPCWWFLSLLCWTHWKCVLDRVLNNLVSSSMAAPKASLKNIQMQTKDLADVNSQATSDRSNSWSLFFWWEKNLLPTGVEKTPIDSMNWFNELFQRIDSTI